MTRNQLPEGVGKKIVEALKQDEAETRILEDAGVPNFVQPQQVLRQENVYEPKVDIRNSTIAQMQEPQFENKIDITDLELPDNVMMLVKLVPAGALTLFSKSLVRLS